jgi:hypothetical protein
MSAENSSRVQFDDRPALEELERLQRSIQEYRRKREQAEGEFEQFVGAFKVSANGTPAQRPIADSGISPMKPVVAPAAAAAAPAASLATPTEPDHAMIAATGGRPPQVAVPPGFFSEAPRSVAFDDESPAENEALAGKPGSRSRMPLILGAGAVLVVAAFLFTRASSSPAPSSPSASAAPVASSPAADPANGAISGPAPTSPAVSAAPSQAVAPSAPTPSPATAPRAAAPAPPAEVRTLRRVWLRVVVDGNRAVEREVEANASIPLPAGHTFVIRAGDAGAVQFFLNGHDQGPLGAEAQVVTRTFTSASGSAPVRAR